MYRRIAAVLFPVLLLALVGAGYWGYQEHQEKNAILIKTENQYQRAFHELNNHIDQLRSELGKVLAVNSRRGVAQTLSNVWRLAYAAQEDVGQLPLTLMPFNKTEEFLSKIGNFAYQTAIRDLTKEPLTPQEQKTLETLYKQATEIQRELNKVQTAILERQLRWMDVELALASEDKQMDNTIIDGLRTVDDRVRQYGELDFGVEAAYEGEFDKNELDKRWGQPITAEEAKKRALAFLGVRPDANLKVRVVENKRGVEYRSYSVAIRRPGDKADQDVNVDVTYRGGHVLWMLDNRPVDKPRLTLDQGLDKATAFLKQRGLSNMEAMEVSQYDGVGVYKFVATQNGVRLYPDAVAVQVALDSGRIVGYSAESYLRHHRPRTLPAPGLTEAQARRHLNGHVRVEDAGLALIKNDTGREVLCYEFLVRNGQDRYRIFLNAQTGEEEKIEDIPAAATPR
ncbi:MAG: germination protein YpeB [Calditerricola sp.]|jgi:germination protein YpeB|nr:germination protein YpeB [Bacillota bacterium]MCG0314374.1 germination protein YpeB [Calditerricola sp.]